MSIISKNHIKSQNNAPDSIRPPRKEQLSESFNPTTSRKSFLARDIEINLAP